MDDALESFRRALVGLAFAERALVSLLILIIVGSIGAQVFSRYALGKPLIWPEELATYSFIWATFLGAGLGMKNGRHVRIASFIGRLGDRAAAFARSLVHLGVLALALVLMRQAWKVMPIEAQRSSISLPIELPVSLFFSIPLFVGMASIALTVIYLVADDLRAVAVGRARRPIAPPPPSD